MLEIMKVPFVILFLVLTQISYSQTLLPSIGQFTMPLNTDSVCDYPVTIDNSGFCNPGPEVGDTVPDFTLYDMADNAFTFSNHLTPGKYTLLISGSYTCPVFRNKIPEINGVVTNYSNDVSTYIVYQLEAHPATDTSIYFGYVNPGSANTNQGILFDQPHTYGERKALIDTMNSNHLILAPILIDGPCNEFLDYFGPAPNNAYLVDSMGVIVLKHCWFDRYPVDIFDDLDSVLTGSSSGTNATNGTFTFELDNDSLAIGNPGDILTIGGTFTNLDMTDDVVIELTRTSNNMPDPGWTSAMCIDVCLGPNVNNYILHMPPNSSQHFSFYFFTSTMALGDAQLEFINVNNAGNVVHQGFYAATVPLGMSEQINSFSIYPNPAHNVITLEVDSKALKAVRLYDVLGRDVTSQTGFITTGNSILQIDLSGLANGVYMVKTPSGSQKFIKE